MKYTKKPVTIDAIQWDGSLACLRLIEQEFQGLNTVHLICDHAKDAVYEWNIKTLEGAYEVTPNDYIIRGIKGEFYPCKPDIFAATYSPGSPGKQDEGEGLTIQAPPIRTLLDSRLRVALSDFIFQLKYKIAGRVTPREVAERLEYMLEQHPMSVAESSASSEVVAPQGWQQGAAQEIEDRINESDDFYTMSPHADEIEHIIKRHQEFK